MTPIETQPKEQINNKSFDLAFVGSGISTSFTLLNFLQNLVKNKPEEPIRIVVIERHSEFHTGIPYGSRSGNSSLLITSLVDFLPEPELSKFICWLNNNKEWLLRDFEEEGGMLTQLWLKKHEQAISENNWHDIFIPRRFFGRYIIEKLENEITKAEEHNLATVTLIQNSVENIFRQGKQYLIEGPEMQLNCTKVVLGIGSPPPRTIWPESTNENLDPPLLISNPYEPSLADNLKKIDTFLSHRTNKETNVLVIGANASALEILYKLNDLHGDSKAIKNFMFISSLGLVPDSVIDEEALKSFQAKNLLALKAKSGLTAQEIADAANADLDVAESMQIGAATTIKPISKAFGDLLGALSPEELENFACFHGNEIGRRQRCAGRHYSEVIEDLRGQKRFEHIAGRYLGIKTDLNKDTYLEYRDSASGEIKLKDTPLHLIINCIGSEQLDNKNINPLYQNLLASGICQPNKSLRGFTVNEDLEASPNFHVVGPLLAGNVLDGRALWHLEHCGRIIWSSSLMANKLVAGWVKEKSPAN